LCQTPLLGCCRAGRLPCAHLEEQNDEYASGRRRGPAAAGGCRHRGGITRTDGARAVPFSPFLVSALSYLTLLCTNKRHLQ
jgi:hypothetical protein